MKASVLRADIFCVTLHEICFAGQINRYHRLSCSEVQNVYCDDMANLHESPAVNVKGKIQ